MTVRPNEEEQIQMIIKNLLPSYHRFTIIYFPIIYWPDFKKLIALGMQEEDSINNGMLKNEEAPKSKRLQTSGSNSKFLEVSNINKPPTYKSTYNLAHREDPSFLCISL